ncbi:MAG: hypothetical protein H6843_02005 [Rhodospirillaceae bacterium]|nr:hypothetical protein [Rhodospirillaceae bacterium]
MSRDRPSPLRFAAVALVLALVIYGAMTVGRLWFDGDHLAEEARAGLAELGLADVLMLPDPLTLGWEGGPVVETDRATATDATAGLTLELEDVVGRLNLAQFAAGAVVVDEAAAATGRLSIATGSGQPVELDLAEVRVSPESGGWHIGARMGPDGVPAVLSLSPRGDGPLAEAAALTAAIDGGGAALQASGSLALAPALDATLAIDTDDLGTLVGRAGLPPDLQALLAGIGRFSGQVSVSGETVILTGAEATIADTTLSGDLSLQPDALSGRITLATATLSPDGLDAWQDGLDRLGERTLDLAITVDALALADQPGALGRVSVRLEGTTAAPQVEIAPPGDAADAPSQALAMVADREMRDAQLRIADLAPLGAEGTLWIGLPDAADDTLNLLFDLSSLDLDRALSQVPRWLAQPGGRDLFLRLRADEVRRGDATLSDVDGVASWGADGLTALVEDARIGDGRLDLEVSQTPDGARLALSARQADAGALAGLLGLPPLVDGPVAASANLTLGDEAVAGDASGLAERAAAGSVSISARDGQLQVPEAWRTLDRAADLPERLTFDHLRLDGRLEAGTLDIVQGTLIAGDIEVDLTGTVDLRARTVDLSVLYTRRSDDGTARVGGSLDGPLEAPSLHVTRR